MAKPATSLPAWAGAGNYPASIYPLTLPWGDPNPVGGAGTPWSGQPRINAAGLIAFADAGFTPQIPTPASPFNAWLDLSQQYAAWVEEGSSSDGADAHIMETNGSGFSKAQRYEATVAFAGAGGTPAPLENGATVPGGEDIELVGDATISGGTGSVVQADTIEGATFKITAPGGTPTLRKIGAGTNDVLLWNDGNIRAVHYSTTEYIYATGDQQSLTVSSATTQVPFTTVRLLPKIAINVRVIAEGWGQRSVAGDVQLRLQADDGFSNYSGFGTSQTATWVDTSVTNLFSFFRIERIFAAGQLLNRFYRLEILGLGGSTARIRGASIRAVPER